MIAIFQWMPKGKVSNRNEKTNTRKKERGNTMKNVCYGVAFAAMLIAVNAIVLASMMGFNNLMELVQVI